MLADRLLEPARRLRRVAIEARYRAGAAWRRSRGTTSKPRIPPVIVTLTSFGDRLNSVHLTVESLLSQSTKPDRVILWQSVAIDQLPRAVRTLESRGLEIRQVPDLGPVTKVLYAFQEFPDAVLVTADDDLIYPRHWLQELLETHTQYPRCVICHRGHLMTWASPGRLAPYGLWSYEAPGHRGPSLMLFPTGVSGVLYPPGSMHADVTNVDLNQAICRSADDIWLKAMSLRQGTLCVKIRETSSNFYVVRGTQEQALWRTNTLGTTNDDQLRRVFEQFDLEKMLWMVHDGGERPTSLPEALT